MLKRDRSPRADEQAPSDIGKRWKAGSQFGSLCKTYNDYTVGWVCALPKEQTAAIAMLDQMHPPLPNPQNDYNTYTLGMVTGHHVVIACLPKGRIGNSSSAAVAARMFTTFPSIEFCVLVGIGGGIPPKVRLGDVVISAPLGEFPGVIQWDMGKAEGGGHFRRTGFLNNPPSKLLAALSKLETAHELNGPEIPRYLEDLERRCPKLASTYARRDSLEDVLFQPNYGHINEGRRASDGNEVGKNRSEEDGKANCYFCDRTKTIERGPRSDLRVHYGLIASGNQVIKDAIFRDKLNADLGGLH